MTLRFGAAPLAEFSPESISRRRFLIASAPFVLLAPGAVLAPDSDAAKKKRRKPARRRWYALSPEYVSSRRCNVRERRKPGDCHGCKACHAHGKNKMFATRRAAERNRAHAGCKCKVVRGGTLDAATWAALFGGLKKPKRRVVERRSKRTKQILARSRRRRRRRRRLLRQRKRKG